MKMKSDEEKEAGTQILRDYGFFFKKQLHDLLSISGNEHWEDNKTFMPIEIFIAPTELIPISDLVSSDNTSMTKVLTVLSSLCVEVLTLKKEAFKRHFKFLSVYEEYNESYIHPHMEDICLLSAFVSRCNDTLRNLCNQIFAIFIKGVINLSGIQLHYIINHVSELFTLIVILELLIANTSIAKKWTKYYKTLKTFNHMPESVNLNDEKLTALINAAENITSKLMNDDIVQNSINNLLTLRKNLVDKSSETVAGEFTGYLKNAIVNLDKLVQDKPNVHNMYKCIKVNALFVLTYHLFGNVDKKIFRSLMELNMKAHSIHIYGTTMWFPEPFLQRYVPTLCANNNKLPQNMLRARHAYISSKKTSLAKDVATLQTICTNWIISVEDSFSNNNDELKATEMNQQAKIMLDGVDICSSISHSVLVLINLHLSLKVALPKNMLMLLFEIIDMMKSLQNVVTRNRHHIIKSVNMIVQHLTFQAAASIFEVKKSMMTDKNYGNKRLDELTCLVIAEKALKGATTIERNVAANVALSFVPESTYLEESYERIGNLLEQIKTLSLFIKSIKQFCNCAWMLWHQNVIPIYFEQNFIIQLNVMKLNYFLLVLEDCALYLHQCDKYYGNQKSQDFINCMKHLIHNNILQVASQNIETNLRLHTHSHLQLDVAHPFMQDMTKKLLLVMNKLRISTVYLTVAPSAEHYLSTMYYNLTTVVLSDWKTYGEMRQMAKFKFNLQTVQDNLPTQTLEQGLDVLEIMRNIHIFVSKYLYNLNNQIFIEKSSNNKHLNSINIRNIANSIRTHGTGIMNTTVNFTYQFLKKKFFTFSQFMYDEHIKSRLIKDFKSFKEIADSTGKMYPYRNAEKFNKGIKTLGLADDGQTYLDLFRNLISQIGNAMGYVRMIRSGGRHCCSDATVFLPDLESSQLFNELNENANLESSTSESCLNLDNSINELVANFTQGTEYFKLLVDVFAPVFRNPKNIHLKNFFIIVPPLTLNFVEHMILSKDKMTKKNKVGAAFTDDGFAMGVAYILKLLEQDSSFEALHWFDSVWKHIGEERKRLEEQKINGSVQLQQALALTEKKIKILEEEFKLLYYSLTSARIFFR